MPPPITSCDSNEKGQKMPKVQYIERKFAAKTQLVIDQANTIIEEYEADGYDLTLRQLFYQFVSRDLLSNTSKEYDRLGSIINDARLAGQIDWERVVDRTRNLHSQAHWRSPSAIVRACAEQFIVDKWANQEYRIECFPSDTPVMTSRGTVPIGAIEVGDFVLTGKGRFCPVTKVIRNTWSGNLLRIKAAGMLPFMVTPNHPVYVRPYDSTRPGFKGAKRKFWERAFLPADQLKPYDLLTVPGVAETEAVESVAMPGGSRSKAVESVPITEQFLAVIGVYLAEGMVRADGRTTQFTLNAVEEHQSTIVKAWAESIGLSHHEYFGNGARVVYVFGKALADFLQTNFGTGSFNKRLPLWVMMLPVEQQSKVLEYYFRGDGCFWDETRMGIAATSRSSCLLTQIQLTLIRMGFGSSIDVIDDHGEPRYRITIAGVYGVELAAKWGVKVPQTDRRYNHVRAGEGDGCRIAEHPIRSILAVPYVGEVVNLEVQDDHTYCVPSLVHNCWIEKEALAGVFERVCDELDLPFFACRGYTSQSEMWAAGQRLKGYKKKNQTPIILHFGDHDPSGIDMTRDITDRLKLFMGGVRLERLALNMAQIHQHNPPPNPAKMSDSRAEGYVATFGDESWELDALEPQILAGLVRDFVLGVRDEAAWEASLEEERDARAQLEHVADNWGDITDSLA